MVGVKAETLTSLVAVRVYNSERIAIRLAIGMIVCFYVCMYVCMYVPLCVLIYIEIQYVCGIILMRIFCVVFGCDALTSKWRKRKKRLFECVVIDGSSSSIRPFKTRF